MYSRYQHQFIIVFVVKVCICHNCCADVCLAYLLYRCVFDSLGVVVVVDNFKVFNRRGEGNIQRCFTGSFSQRCEMSWFTALHTWSGTRRGKHVKCR